MIIYIRVLLIVNQYKVAIYLGFGVDLIQFAPV